MEETTIRTGKTSSQLDIIANWRCEKILEWASDKDWFNTDFIVKMYHQDRYSVGQRDAIKRIYDKFIGDE